MPGRRDWLIGTAALLFIRDALSQGRLEKGVYRVSGDVRINGEPARPGATVRAGDTLKTGADGETIFVIGRDAMLVRRESSASLLKDGLRVATGAVLSVFSPGERRRIQTGTAVIGIRGTAVYVEAEPSRTYVCTCYGEAVLAPRDDPKTRETVRTTHHE